MTQNIQGLITLSKQDQVLQTMSINNIDILGLSETKLTNKSSKYIYKNNSEYITYFDNKNEHTIGSEVSLIFAKEYANYIHCIQDYKGQIIYADLFLKGQFELRII